MSGASSSSCPVLSHPSPTHALAGRLKNRLKSELILADSRAASSPERAAAAKNTKEMTNGLVALAAMIPLRLNGCRLVGTSR